MFSYAVAVTGLDLSSFKTPKLTNIAHIFEGCGNLESVIFGNNIDTSQVTDMSYLFTDCYSITSLDLSKFSTGNG